MPLSAIFNKIALTASASAALDTAGSTISFAVDFDSGQFWFTSPAMRTQYGVTAWNNSGTANPSTGTGGLSISLFPAAHAPFYPIFSDLEAGGSAIINNGVARSFSINPPIGFIPWGNGNSTNTLPAVASGQIVGLATGTITQSSVILRWATSTVGTLPIRYQVQYSKIGTSTWYNGPNVFVTNCTVIDLLPNTQYSFQVFGVNDAGVGIPSAPLTATTAASTGALLSYRGLTVKGSDLSSISSLSTAFPHANSIIIPVFCSTANQTSTDVTLVATLATVQAWIQAAGSAGFTSIFLGIYLTCRDGSPGQTITPGPSLASVTTFMNNLLSVCQSVAQIGAQYGLMGMFCGIELQPWGGQSVVNSGPFDSRYVALWKNIYLTVKSIWPRGIITYSALQTSLGLTIPASGWAVDWSFWDAIAISLYPGSSNDTTLSADFQSYFETRLDPDTHTVNSVGQLPLFSALVNFSNAVGRKIIITQCGIIPALGNQASPGNANALPPPYNYNMQSAWWQAVLNEITKYADNFSGIFVLDAGTTGYSSAYSGINYYGLQGTSAADFVDQAFSTLSGIVPTLTAPTNLSVTATTTSSISVSWTGIPGTGISYIVQYSVQGANTWTSLLATANTSNTIPNLLSNTSYDLRVYGKQGTIIGPTSSIIQGTTATASTTRSITINDPGTINTSVAFTVSGKLIGYTSAPVLTYVDDPVLGSVTNVSNVVSSTDINLSWQPGAVIQQTTFPTNAVVTATDFSFTHPGVTTGSHVLEVTDGTIFGTFNYSATVVTPTPTPPVPTPPVPTPPVPTPPVPTPPTLPGTITITTPIVAVQGSTFRVTGSLGGFTSTIPTLVYSDDGGTNQPISPSSVTLTTFTVAAHPAWSATGNHTITVSVSGNSAVSATASYSVIQPAIPGPVTGFMLGAAPTDTSEFLVWTAPDTLQVYTYNLGVSLSATGPFNAVGVTAATSTTIGGLTPATDFYWSLTAQGPTGLVGPVVVAGPFRTTGGVLPTQVTGVTATRSAPNALAVTWNAATGTAPITYNVYTGPSATGPWTLASGGVTTNSVTLNFTPANNRLFIPALLPLEG